MTVKRKKKGSFTGGRTVTVAFSLCLLAVVTMIGMYTVGRTDEQQKKLEQQVAEAEQKAQAQAEKEEREREEAALLEQQKQEAASASAARDKEGEAQEEAKAVDGAELESEFAMETPELAETPVIEEMTEAGSSEAVSEEPTLSFSADSDQLLWPVAGNVILDYSMDKTVYFPTLDQYKYNPAVIIQGNLDETVLSAAQGKVTKVETLEETGLTVTTDIGDGYEIVYGQLKELAVKEGDFLKAGETVGYVSEPTRFYSKDGCNLYFEVKKDGTSIDPMTLLQ